MHTYLAAALFKKTTPVNIVTKRELATHTLSVAPVEVETVTTGKKLVNCLFAYCAGSEDKASTAVTLVSTDGVVEWSYAVNKRRGAKNMQSMGRRLRSTWGII